MNVLNNNFFQAMVLVLSGMGCAVCGKVFTLPLLDTAAAALIGAALLHIKPTV